MASYSIESIDFSPEGSEFAVSAVHNSYGVVARWRVGEREPHAVTGRLEWGCNALVWSPDGALFAGACRDKVIRIWGVDRFELQRDLASPGCQSRCLGFSADGRMLVSLDQDNERCLRSWNPATGAMSWHIADGGRMFSFVPESDRIAVIPLANSEPREVRFRSCRDGALVDRIEVGIHASAIAFSSDGHLMAISGAYSTPGLELWDVERRLRIGVIEMEDLLVHGMRFVDSDRAVAVIAWYRYGHPPLLVWRLDGVLQSRAD
jgi:WD40 repeat protein